MQRHQRETNQVPLEKGLDVFHTKQEAHRVLSIQWKRVERFWERAEAADRALKQARRQGRSDCGLTHPVRKAWKKATLAFQLYEKREAAWKRVEPALDVFRPDGQLNDRAWARASRRRLRPGPRARNGPRFAGLKTAESFTFLDRLHDQLGQLSVPEALREAREHLWWLCRQRPIKSTETAVVSSEDEDFFC